MEKQKRNFITLGPVPVMALGEVYAQLEEQGWEVKAVIFAGMTQSAIAVPGQAGAFPVFMFIASKNFGENEKIVNPSIKMQGLK
jgi:hypothetical protein